MMRMQRMLCSDEIWTSIQSIRLELWRAHLELSGRDLKALDLDQLLDAIDHKDEPVRVDVANVARVQPPVGLNHVSLVVRFGQRNTSTREVRQSKAQ